MTAPGILLVVSSLGITALFALGPGKENSSVLCVIIKNCPIILCNNYHYFSRRCHPVVDGGRTVSPRSKAGCCYHSNHSELVGKLCGWTCFSIHSG